MKLTLLCVGKLKERATSDWINEFLKRLNKYCRLDSEEIKESSIAKEGEELLKRIRYDDFVIVFDRHGASMTSEQFAAIIKDITMKKRLVFVVGGPEGLSNAVVRRGNAVVSFGLMTFTHQIARLLIVEQVYRAFTIIKGEKYHK